MACCRFYVNLWVVSDHLVIHVLSNQIFEERTVFLRLIDAGICSTFLYIGYFRGFNKSHYTHHVVFLSSFLLCLSLIWVDP